MTPQEFGALIRSRREAKGLSIEEIAARIKLSARTLRSMEEGRFDGLPHVVYARGFVRSYVLSAGLTEEEAEQGLFAIFPPAMFEDAHPQPGPIDRQRNSKDKGRLERLLAVALVLLLLCLPVAAGWFVFTRYDKEITGLAKRAFSAVQPGAKVESSAPPVSTSAGAAGGAAAQERALPQTPPARVESSPAPVPGETSDSPAPPAAGAESAATRSAPAAQTAVPPPASGQNTVVVEARSACWVKVTADDAEARTTTVQPGETSVFPFKKNLTITLGNAAGVTLHYNGKPFPATGLSGSVKTYTFPPRP